MTVSVKSLKFVPHHEDLVAHQAFLIELMMQGTRAWNAWRDDRTNVKLSLTDVDFTKFDHDFSFYSFHFGNDIIFRNAIFGDNIDLMDTTFGNNINFMNAIFGNYDNFMGAAFGNDIDFKGVSFENNINFSHVLFGERTLL